MRLKNEFIEIDIKELGKTSTTAIGTSPFHLFAPGERPLAIQMVLGHRWNANYTPQSNPHLHLIRIRNERKGANRLDLKPLDQGVKPPGNALLAKESILVFWAFQCSLVLCGGESLEAIALGVTKGEIGAHWGKNGSTLCRPFSIITETESSVATWGEH